MLKAEHAAPRATFTYAVLKTCTSWIVMIDGPVRMRTCLTSGQKADALADADAPNVPDFVADGAIDDDDDVDAVTLDV